MDDIQGIIYSAVIEKRHYDSFLVNLMSVEQCRLAAKPRTKPTNLDHESARRLQSSISTIAINSHYSAIRVTLILPPDAKQKAESM